MKKVKAFTIIELLVTLVITSIIFGIASSLYLNFQQYYNSATANNDRCNKIVMLETLLKYDFENSQVITASFERVTVLSNENTLIDYDFDRDYILRTKNFRTDTFFIKPVDFSTKRLDENFSIISEMEFTINPEGVNLPVHFYKDYTNDVLFINAQKSISKN